jgi:signal transduction histidine kinase
MTAWLRRGVSPADLALGAVLTGLGVVLATDEASGASAPARAACIATVTLPVIWRRRAPLGCAAALLAGAVISGIPTFHQVRCGVAIPAALLVVYEVGARRGRRDSLAGLALVLAAMTFLSFTDSNLDPAALAFIAPLCLGAWVAGLVVRSRNRLAAALGERSRELERRRGETARLAVEVERTRLAAELDTAARRRVQEMLALTDEGRAALGEDPERTRAAFARIERTGRESLDEMRGLLGALRSDEAAGRAPQPTLSQLDALLAGADVAGPDVEGARRPLPAGVELAAYRTVEHALAILVRPDGVRLRYGDDGLELEIAGARAAGLAGDEALVAARERVRAHGGHLRLDAEASGRTVLRARIPAHA